MEDSQPQPSQNNVFSVRIVSIDYYMAAPIPDLDICYSSFQGGKVNEVPVIRIYGSTPAGQKTCLHIHRALPYLYIPFADLMLESVQEGDACTQLISLSLEKVLKLKASAGLKRQHVHGCSLVRARRFYGYHSSEELFVKIYLYHPHDVSRAANFLLGGAVLDRSFQPHESHIPFLLQFLVDYNLYGMAHLHASKMKFRRPVPNASGRERYCCNETRLGRDNPAYTSEGFQADSRGDESLRSPIWISSTVPDGWIWECQCQLESSSCEDVHHVKRQSTCELEGDTTVDEILNQQFKMYSSLSQTRSDLKMVQSLIPIWEEYERTGVHDVALASDPEKPLPKDVLRTLSLGLDEFECKFVEHCKETANDLPCTQSEKVLTRYSTVEGTMVEVGLCDMKEAGGEALKCLKLGSKTGMVLPQDLPCEHDNIIVPGEGKLLYPKQLLASDMQPTTKTTMQSSDVKVVDKEAMGLLSWLASSQAAEDINSDDDLACETILTPLLPATTIDKMLEKANMDFESESQQECKDILDSVENLIDFEVRGERTSSTNHNYLNQSSSGIPQMDGSADDQNSIPDNGKSSMEISNEIKRFLDDDVQQVTHASFTSTSKRSKPLWGSLPFSSKQEMNDVVQPPSKCYNEMNKHKFTGSIVGNDADIVFNVSKEESTLVGCSVRDLMRKKRFFHSEPSEFESQGIQKAVSKEELHQKQLSTGILQNHGQDIQEMSIGYCKKDNMDEPEFVGSIEPGTFDSCIGKSDRLVKDTNLSVPPSSVSSAITLGENPVELIGMTFHKKPPLLNQTVGTLDTPMSYANIAQRNFLQGEESFEGTSAVQRQLIEEFPPFFGKDCLVDGDIQKKSPSSNELDHHECVIGVPTHYQNDGSYLYMLTPVFSPPSADTVSRWLLHDNSVDDLGEHAKAVSVDSPSPKGFSGSQISSQGSLIGEKHSPQCGSVFRADHIMDEQKQQSHKDLITEINPCVVEENAIGQIEYNIVKQEEYSDCPLDISQISGPDGKSKPTPLSQIGFQDPASFGGGQQLTLLSIEVQAETRGDLRPDPQFDAVNIIVLAFQEDNDSSLDVYVLLRSDADHHSNLNGISGCKMLVSLEEKQLFSHFMNIICSTDPDILIGWDIQGSSLGFLAERAIHLGINLLNCISRISTKTKVAAKESSLSEGGLPEPVDTESIQLEDPVIEDEWGRTHASGIHVGGRVVLNVWRLMRGELKLNTYTVEAVTEAVLRRKVPSIPYKVLARWFSSGPGQARYRCIEYMVGRANLNLEIINQLDMINRTSELARIFGIDFFSVLSRGSQYRVESMFLRLARTQNYVAISPGSQQVAYQPAMECLPLVMEPESGFYMDPVVVLDFQSLYPSMIIAYNLCFCTCLGNIMPSKANTLGVSSYSPDLHVLRSLKDEILLAPNGVMYVPSKVRKGVLPRLLEEILSTRIMVKQAMKKLASSQQVLRRIFNARQLALKLIANVTYGYTAAGFSGRMPCAELADSIVQCGRRTLENAISFVNSHDKWKAEVIYGDTDSMFVLLRGRSIKEAFEIGNDIASAVTAANPNPVTLKMEKVYHPCFLLTKKRYVGYSYENPDQVKPIFDAKGIETVRRDTCPAVAKIMEQSLRIFFEHKDIHKVKAYLLRQWTRILSGRVSLQDFVFAKEVRLGAYSSRTSSSLPPAAIVATKAMRADPRAEPRYAERIPYVVVHGEPGSRLVDMVVDPLDLLAINSPFRLNDTYYITKQIIPALQRVFGLVGADLNQWFSDMPRPVREFVAKRHSFPPSSHRTRIDYYYLSKHCILCGDLVQGAAHLCGKCSKNKAASVTAIVGRTSKLEKEIQHLAAICRHCGGGDWLLESGVKCTSLACSVFYERRKVQKELQSLSSIATDAGLYPRCMVEWF